MEDPTVKEVRQFYDVAVFVMHQDIGDTAASGQG